MSIQHDSLDILDIRIILQCSAVEADLLAHPGDFFAVVVAEDVQFEDAVGDIWRTHKINLKNFRLQMAFVWSVVFERFEEEGGALLQLVKLQENVHDLVDLCLWRPIVSVGDHFGKANGGLGVDRDDLSHDLDEIGDVAGLVAIGQDLIQLVGFNQSLDDFFWISRLLKHTECELRVGASDQVAEFVR